MFRASEVVDIASLHNDQTNTISIGEDGIVDRYAIHGVVAEFMSRAFKSEPT